MADKALALETRTVTAPLELRDDGDGGPRLIGYAATFDQPYDMGAFREVVDPGAFTRTLSSKPEPDVRLLIDHAGQPLARTKSGTLTLRDRDESGRSLPGLYVEATLDPTDPDVQRLLPKMRRGDLDQMSFAFRVMPGGDSWSDDFSQRTLRALELNGGDVSVVTYPANPLTSVSVRAQDQRTAAAVWVETLMRETRVGKTISAANLAKLQQVLASLAEIDTALDAAGDSLDDAQAQMADVLGVANPDPDVQDDGPRSRPLGLALAIARAL